MGGSKTGAAACVRLERLMLQESFQRWGVIKLIAEGLRQHGYRYLILSSITNKPFARYLHEQSKLEGSKWELLGAKPLDDEGQLKSCSVFPWPSEVGVRNGRSFEECNNKNNKKPFNPFF